MVIVDEAHACLLGTQDGKGRQLRIIRSSAWRMTQAAISFWSPRLPTAATKLPSVHLQAFSEKFVDLPEDLDTDACTAIRQELARHLVQRRRADIRHFLQTDTSFPTRLDKEESYVLSNEYKALFEKTLELARELVDDPSGKEHHRRVRWWSALALLRALSPSSPAAAAATLKTEPPLPRRHHWRRPTPTDGPRS